MNPDLDRLQAYPFERLGALLRGVAPPRDLPPIPLSLGEPRHPTPAFIPQALVAQLQGLATYPATRGTGPLRAAIAGWLTRRFSLPAGSVDPERHVLPVNGTREALFAFAQAVVDRRRDARVLMPNPFYQIYEGAALLAGATPWYVACEASTGFLPDFDAVPPETWDRCQLVYLCSPGNPTGAVLAMETLEALIERADRHDFVIAADECYSEIYPDEAAPPPGLLQAAARMGRTGWERCVVFHSLSKRSSVPGMRSGFVAGDARVIERFLLYRTYHGCAMPPPVQAASAAAWADEHHVAENRALYRRKLDAVLEVLSPVLDVRRPDGAFYLWPRVAGDETAFARDLFARKGVTVLPGRYLSRPAEGADPGRGRLRLALVAPLDDCVEAAGRIRDFLAETGRGT
ncbi:MAG: succinyldiaminopimelate transaminase [Gammaproteobacteria bacterium]|nr:succinyldiaminopimelate transaminase [Gammaproteobacteria bacterium]